MKYLNMKPFELSNYSDEMMKCRISNVLFGLDKVVLFAQCEAANLEGAKCKDLLFKLKILKKKKHIEGAECRTMLVSINQKQKPRQ